VISPVWERRKVGSRRLACAALVLVATGLPAGCGSGAKQADRLPVRTLRALVLLPRDAPGFSSFDSGPQVGVDAHRGPRHATNRFGRQDGWKARYRRDDATAKKGPLVVESRADVFSDDGGAGKDIAAYASEWKETARSAGASTVSYPHVHLGNEARALDLLQGSRTAGQRLIVVAWRRGRVTASVSVSGYPSLQVEDALTLARKQDRRVEKLAG